MLAEKLSGFQRTKAFISVGIPLALAKFFQETLYVMSYFMEKDFGVSSALIYETAKYQPLGVAAGYIATAFLVDQLGIKKILTVNMALMAITLIGFIINQRFEMLLFYRLTLGIWIGTIYNCSFGALPVIFETHELPKKTASLYTFAFLSSMLGPVTLTVTEAWFSWRILLAMFVGICLLSSLSVAKYFPQKTDPTTFSQYAQQIKKLIRNRTFLLMIIVSTLCMGGFYGFVALFMKNLEHLGISSAISKFIVADMQFVSRIILLVIIGISSVKLTPKAVPTTLKAALAVMAVAAAGLFSMLLLTGSLFGKTGLIASLIEIASKRVHVFTTLLGTFSGVWLFWIYAGLIGIAQPANKSKALSIAGKSMSGSAQAIIGFCLSVGEFIFAIMASYQWPYGAYSFLLFTVFAALIVIKGVIKNKAEF